MGGVLISPFVKPLKRAKRVHVHGGSGLSRLGLVHHHLRLNAKDSIGKVKPLRSHVAIRSRVRAPLPAQ